MSAELVAAGWFLVYGVDGVKRTWHYFDAGQLRSRCGGAAGYQRSYGSDCPVERTPQLSSVALLKAPFCRRCDRTRRREEGR